MSTEINTIDLRRQVNLLLDTVGRLKITIDEQHEETMFPSVPNEVVDEAVDAVTHATELLRRLLVFQRS